MSDPHVGNIQPKLDLEEHKHDVAAKRVAVVDASGNQITTFGAAGGATETTLAAIKDTDGIKKIVDPVAVTGTFYPTTQSVEEAGLAGTGTTGTLALASANTWYACPSTAPTNPYILIATIENSAGTVRMAFSNGTTPSAIFGNLAPGQLIIRLAASQVVYFASSTAGDDVNWTCKEIS